MESDKQIWKSVYKNIGKDSAKRRHRRAALTSKIRKHKREESFMKKRITSNDCPIPELNPGDLERVILNFNSNDEEHIEKGLEFLMHILNGEHPSIKTAIVEAKIVPALTDLLLPVYPSHIQLRACLVLTSLIVGTSDHTRAVVESQGIDKLIQLFNFGDNENKIQAALALGNIAADYEGFRNTIVDQGLIHSLLREIGNTNAPLDFLICASNLIAVVSNQSYETLSTYVLKQCLGATRMLVIIDEDEILGNVLAILLNITEENEEIYDLFGEGLIARIINLISHPIKRINLAAIQIIANIAGYGIKLCEIMNENQILDKLIYVFSQTHEEGHKNALWCLDNLIVDNAEVKQAIIDNGILMTTIRLLKEGNYKCQMEAAYVIFHVAYCGNTSHISSLLSFGAIEPICTFLKIESNESILICLDILTILLQETKEQNWFEIVCSIISNNDGISKIEEMQYHENTIISEKCQNLFAEFFSNPEEILSMDYF